MAKDKKKYDSQGREIIPLKQQKELPQQLNPIQLNELGAKTPRAFIKQRKGRGGGQFDYVEIGYVIDKLNRIFGPLGWDSESELVPELSTELFVTVKATLTIKDHKGSFIKKQAFGGVDRKFFKNKPHIPANYVDIADDAKSAEADAMKKAASKFGVAFDVFYPDVIRIKELVVKEESPAPFTCDRCKKLGKEITITEQQAKMTKDFFGFKLCNHCRMEAMKYKAEKEENKSSKTTEKMVQCKRCSKEISEAQAKYSKKMFKKPLCKECQKKEK